MSELLSALDELVTVGCDGLSEDGLLDLVGELVTATNRVTAALTSAVRAADWREAYRRDGAVSMKAWLRGSCRMAPDQATATASTGRRLEQLPETAAAFAAGGISAAHAHVINEWCAVHHVVHWAHGGPTSCDNGALLCERHHTSCHEGRFTIRRDPGTGRWHTYRPDGSEVLGRAGP